MLRSLVTVFLLLASAINAEFCPHAGQTVYTAFSLKVNLDITDATCSEDELMLINAFVDGETKLVGLTEVEKAAFVSTPCPDSGNGRKLSLWEEYFRIRILYQLECLFCPDDEDCNIDCRRRKLSEQSNTYAEEMASKLGDTLTTLLPEQFDCLTGALNDVAVEIQEVEDSGSVCA